MPRRSKKQRLTSKRALRCERLETRTLLAVTTPLVVDTIRPEVELTPGLTDLDGDGAITAIDVRLYARQLAESPTAPEAPTTSGAPSVIVPGGLTHYRPLTHLDVRFTSPTPLSLANISLDVRDDGGGNLLTSANAPVPLRAADGTWDGLSWRVPNLFQATLQPGRYTFRVNAVQSHSGALNGAREVGFFRDTQIADSDEFMRIILNSSIEFWDHRSYTNLEAANGQANMALGTVIRYDADGVAKFDASADPVGGLSAVPGRESAASAYDRLYAQYKADHPEALVGLGLGWQSVKSPQTMREEGRWPSENILSTPFHSSCLASPLPSTPHADGTVDFTLAHCSETFYREVLDTSLGKRGAPRSDVAHFDEVFYTPKLWDTTVQLLRRLKNDLNDNGVLLSINLGGWGWVDPFFYGPNILQEVPQITDSLMLESIWNRSEPHFGSFRGVYATQKIISNLRYVMDRGVNVNLLHTTHDWNANVLDVLAIDEVPVRPYNIGGNNPFGETTPGLRLTLSRPHRIFPTAEPPSIASRSTTCRRRTPICRATVGRRSKCLASRIKLIYTTAATISSRSKRAPESAVRCFTAAAPRPTGPSCSTSKPASACRPLWRC